MSSLTQWHSILSKLFFSLPPHHIFPWFQVDTEPPNSCGEMFIIRFREVWMTRALKCQQYESMLSYWARLWQKKFKQRTKGQGPTDDNVRFISFCFSIFQSVYRSPFNFWAMETLREKKMNTLNSFSLNVYFHNKFFGLLFVLLISQVSVHP